MEDAKVSILFPVLLTVPVLVLVWVIATQSPAQPRAKLDTPSTVRAIYRTTATQLYRDYNSDALGTQQRIGQRRILVTGTIVDVSQNYLGQNLVLLDVGNGISTADMTLAPDQNALALQLKRGQVISVFCEQMQRYSDSPSGTECTLVAPLSPPGLVSRNDSDARQERHSGH